MSNIHTCSYSCHRPECIKAQRDSLVTENERLRDMILVQDVSGLVEALELVKSRTRHDDMTLRDYFAAKALAALIGHEGKDGNNCGKKAVPTLAKWSYEYADAILAAREK